MLNKFRYNYAVVGAAFSAGMLAKNALALPSIGTQGDKNGFSSIFERLTLSFQDLPGLISAFAYLLGIIFAIAGILKMKDYVEDPSRTQLKDAVIRLVAGGGLFALPAVMDVMASSVGDQSQDLEVNTLKKAKFGTN